MKKNKKLNCNVAAVAVAATIVATVAGITICIEKILFGIVTCVGRVIDAVSK